MRSPLVKLPLIPASAFLSFAFLTANCFVLLASAVQTQPPKTIQGYVISVDSPQRFFVDETEVDTTASTVYQWLGEAPAAGAASPPAVKVGVYIQASGSGADHLIYADIVRVAKQTGKKLDGFGLIDSVIEARPLPVFDADGYRIRIAPYTTLSFSGRLKTLADVGTNTWVKYEGALDKSGDLIATQAEFSPGVNGKKKPSEAAKDSALPTVIPAQPSRIDAEGDFVSLHAKVRMNSAGGPCGWHRVWAHPALQQRVWRVGMSLVPAFQKRMAADARAKIPFRFFVIDEPKTRTGVLCQNGLILVPEQAVNRLQSDDQLAALLAIAVGWDLQIQSPHLKSQGWELLAVQGAGYASEAFVPFASVAAGAGADVAAARIDIGFLHQCARVSLALMSDAGFNPWAAPEAWRLLAPKKLPKHPSSLNYPNLSTYELKILRQQYRRDEPPQTVSSRLPPPGGVPAP